MANLFDTLRDKAFDVTASVMGYDASWTPSSDSEAEPFTARVHFKEADEVEKLGGIEYMPPSPFMEYRSPFFPGLWEAVREQNGGEVVTVDGRGYDVLKIDKMHDGATYRAYLNPVT